MKSFLLLTVLAIPTLDGCVRVTVSDSPSLTAEMAAKTAYAAVKARRTVAPPPAPGKCCEKCVGGKVKSGDGLAWIPCPCPPLCKCKAP